MSSRPTNVRRLMPGWVCLMAITQGLTALAQEPVIRTNVPLVLVPITVTDPKGKPVDGLRQEDFILYDDGEAQKQVRLDTSDTVLAPVAMVVAIQSSGISEPALARIHRVGAMIQPLVAGERGEAAVLTYDSDVRTLQQFTRDTAFITGAFEIVEPRTIKRAKLVDAVIEGVHLLETRPESYRRIMLILGESRDRGSKAKLDKAVEAAQRAGVALYPMTYSAQKIAWASKPDDAPALPEGPDYAGGLVELARLATTNAADVFARATGGRHLSFTTLDGLEGAISRLGEEVHSQYLLSFAPAQSRNRGYHRIEVSVKSKRDVVVRARPGYWAQP